MWRWFFVRNNLKQDVDDLRKRIDEEVISQGYVGEVIDEYDTELEKLQEQIDSLPSGEPQNIGRRKVVIGAISLAILVGIIVLSIELLVFDKDSAISGDSMEKDGYSAIMASDTENDLQTEALDSIPVPDKPILPDITGTCSAEVTEIPTATLGTGESVLGTTSDPLVYTEPGTYSVSWVYDGGSGAVASQTQTVIVTICEVEPLEWYLSGTIDAPVRGEQTSFYADGYVYSVSGKNYVMGEVTEDGTVTEWTIIDKPPPSASLEIYRLYAIEYHEATNSVYFAGGMSGFDTAHHEVFRCEIQPDHKLGEWVEVNSMVIGRFGPTLRTGEGPNGEQFLYAISGADSNWGFLDTVEFAPINPDGSLGDWCTTSSLNHERPAADGFFHDGKLYIFGGGRHSLRNDTVEAASVRHDGHLSNWEIVGTMNDYRSCLAVAFVPQTNKVYVIGGYTGEYGQDMTNTTEVADISDLNNWKPDGNLQVMTKSLSALTTPESIVITGEFGDTGNVEYASIITSVTGTASYSLEDS